MWFVRARHIPCAWLMNAWEPVRMDLSINPFFRSGALGCYDHTQTIFKVFQCNNHSMFLICKSAWIKASAKSAYCNKHTVSWCHSWVQFHRRSLAELQLPSDQTTPSSQRINAGGQSMYSIYRSTVCARCYYWLFSSWPVTSWIKTIDKQAGFNLVPCWALNWTYFMN